MREMEEAWVDMQNGVSINRNGNIVLELTRPATQETDISNHNESNKEDAGMNEVVEGKRPERLAMGCTRSQSQSIDRNDLYIRECS